MAYATITGVLKDSDGVLWKNATWMAVPVSPSSKPVFSDGTSVLTTSGALDTEGGFSGQVPRTDSILPPGTTLTFTITSLTSYAPVTLTKVQIIAADVDLGALLSARIPAPRIPAAPIVYAYDAIEITAPKHGNGYVNTTKNQSFIYMQNSWQAIGASINPADVAYLDQSNVFTQPQNIIPLGGMDGQLNFGGGSSVAGEADGTLYLTGKGASTVLNWNSQGGEIIFGGGQGTQVASIDTSGHGIFQGLQFNSGWLHENTDLNNELVGGIYFLDNPVNYPAGTGDSRSYILIVLQVNFSGEQTAMVWQLLFNTNVQEFWIRSMAWGTWRAWGLVSHS
jgi:hypothetical protein